jgi:hypothetical protein
MPLPSLIGYGTQGYPEHVATPAGVQCDGLVRLSHGFRPRSVGPLLSEEMH